MLQLSMLRCDNGVWRCNLQDVDEGVETVWTIDGAIDKENLELSLISEAPTRSLSELPHGRILSHRC